MKTPHLPTGDTDTDSAISVGFLTLLASLLVGSLLYLGSYSLGRDFEGRTPALRTNAAIADS
jgi:hypothetical protein